MTYLHNVISASEKGTAGGVASLDSSGDVPVGQLDNSPGVLSTRKVTSSGNILTTDSVILVDTSAAVTLTLLTAAVADGKSYTVKDYIGSASVNNISFATEGSELIDGSSTMTINQNFGAVTLICDGTNWFVI